MLLMLHMMPEIEAHQAYSLHSAEVIQGWQPIAWCRITQLCDFWCSNLSKHLDYLFIYYILRMVTWLGALYKH